ncbi:glycosyl transferase [Microcella alkalica]|uniref:Glycosyltransferase n=1 Tax=Microcella alkalica TaxID=355930 RepID=A0A839E7I1_9MICO|nr:glycosyltransferase [Microcella alkalica]MBA8847730.1 hypothetical protein [Microcella alkalica]
MAPSTLTHLIALTDDVGLFEHARLDVPRREHGYCVDDVARALVAMVREASDDADAPPEVALLTETYLRFLEESMTPDGVVRNRRGVDGAWSDPSGSADWWGRAVWAFGVASAHSADLATRIRASTGVATALAQRTRDRRTHDLRPTVFAALGAAELLLVDQGNAAARDLLERVDDGIPPGAHADWPWPEPTLRYANAAIPEALIAAGTALGRPATIARGLRLLAFLVSVETRDGRLSVTGTTGRARGQLAMQFDQQPVEVAALADACARAFAVTGDPAWLETVALARRWFAGDNDAGTPMVDAVTGAGYDGLEPDGRNENRGAESTLAALTVHQQAARLDEVVLT